SAGFGTLSVFQRDTQAYLSAVRGQVSHQYDCEAQGMVQVPRDAILRLAVYVEDLSPLDALRPDDLQELAFVGARLDGAALVHVGRLTGLRDLDLEGQQGVTDATIEHLAGLTQLKRLDLGATQISDDALKHLVGLRALIELHLYDTAVTGIGLPYLAGCSSLRY